MLNLLFFLLSLLNNCSINVRSVSDCTIIYRTDVKQIQKTLKKHRKHQENTNIDDKVNSKEKKLCLINYYLKCTLYAEENLIIQATLLKVNRRSKIVKEFSSLLNYLN